MGWKSIRDHYRIGHIVRIVEGNVHIGSAYVNDLLKISPDGVVTANRIMRDNEGGDLGRYRREIQANPALFTSLLASEDVYETLVPVFTWNDAGVVEKRAEALGWPNVCTDGELQYENRHFGTRDEAVRGAFRDAEAYVEAAARQVAEAEEDLRRRQERRTHAEDVLARLKAAHPDRAA